MADTKTSALTALTAFTGDETFYVVEDDDGTPVSRRMTIEDLAAGLAARSELSGTYAPLAVSATASVATAQGGATGAFGDLATAGPAVTVTVPASGKVLVILSFRGVVDEQTLYMGVALSGANTVAANQTDAAALGTASTTVVRGTVSKAILMTGLTPGSTTFTAKYRTDDAAGSPSQSFAERSIIVTPAS